MQRRVVVTGVGVLSPLGTSLSESWKNIVAGNKGISKLLDSGYERLPCRVAGVIKDDGGPFDLTKRLPKSILKTMGPATAYALIATQEALGDADWVPTDDAQKNSTGVAIGMGMVDLQDICQTHTAFSKSYNQVSPFFVPRILPNMAAGKKKKSALCYNLFVCVPQFLPIFVKPKFSIQSRFIY